MTPTVRTEDLADAQELAKLLGLGHSSIHDLTPEDLVIPPDFTRRLG